MLLVTLRPARPVRDHYLRYLRMGFTPAIAGNLTARDFGIAPNTRSPWTVAQIETLRFLEELHRTGRLVG